MLTCKSIPAQLQPPAAEAAHPTGEPCPAPQPTAAALATCLALLNVLSCILPPAQLPQTCVSQPTPNPPATVWGSKSFTQLLHLIFSLSSSPSLTLLLSSALLPLLKRCCPHRQARPMPCYAQRAPAATAATHHCQSSTIASPLGSSTAIVTRGAGHFLRSHQRDQWWFSICLFLGQRDIQKLPPSPSICCSIL